MIVNMYVDHLMASPPGSAEEVWNATRVHAKLFSDAAQRIGLSDGDYREFRNALLDGKAMYVRLPRRVDAMAGSRRGSVYAVRNAVMTSSVMGWRVALADGTNIYVPQVCGNISLVRPVHIAQVEHPKSVLGIKHTPAKFHRAVAVIPKEQPVAMVPSTVETPVEVPVAAPVAAQVIPVAAAAGRGLFFFIPAAIGGAIAGITRGNTSTPVAPSCTNGSNSVGVCTTR